MKQGSYEESLYGVFLAAFCEGDVPMEFIRKNEKLSTLLHAMRGG